MAFRRSTLCEDRRRPTSFVRRPPQIERLVYLENRRFDHESPNFVRASIPPHTIYHVTSCFWPVAKCKLCIIYTAQKCVKRVRPTKSQCQPSTQLHQTWCNLSKSKKRVWNLSGRILVAQCFAWRNQLAGFLLDTCDGTIQQPANAVNNSGISSRLLDCIWKWFILSDYYGLIVVLRLLWYQW